MKSFDLKIFYRLPYGRYTWHYKHANGDMVSKAIENFLLRLKNS